MRILIVGSFYEPEPTGIAVYTSGYARHLAGRGHQVTVLTVLPNYPHGEIYHAYQGRFSRREWIDGVEVHRVWIHVSKSQSTRQRALTELSFLVMGLRAMFGPDPDVIIGVVPALSSGVLARLLAMRFKVPYGLMFQDLVAAGAAQSGVPGGARVAGALRHVEAWMLEKVSGISILGAGYRDFFVNLGFPEEKMILVRNWTHIDPPTTSPAELRRRLGVPQEVVLCLHAGNMGFKQGLENVVDCAHLAEQRGEEIFFLLVGDGNQRSQLEERARRLRLKNVRFLDFQPKSLFSSMLAAADILILNQRGSVMEMSLPSKITSYLASGRPIVAAVAEGSEAEQEIRISGGGTIARPDDPAQLLDAILAVVASPDLQAEMGQRGRRYSATVLSEEASLGALDDFVELVRRSSTKRVGTGKTKLKSR